MLKKCSLVAVTLKTTLGKFFIFETAHHMNSILQNFNEVAQTIIELRILVHLCEKQRAYGRM